MKLLCLIVMGLAASAAYGRTWTSTTGSQLEADYVGFRNNTVSLRKADGKAFEIGLQFLSEADRAFVNEQKPRDAAATAPTATAKATSPATPLLSSTGPIRKDLLTEEQIAALKTEMPGKKDNEKYIFFANFSPRLLDAAALKRLNPGRIPYRVTAEFMAVSVENGKTVSKRMTGSVRFYVLDDQGEPLVSKRESLEKMCPT